MGLEEIFQTLEEEGQRERAEVINKAKEQEKRIIEEGEREAKKIKDEQIEKISSSLRREQTRILSEARLANQREIVRTKEEIISKVFTIVKEKTARFREERNYPTVFESLFEETVRNLPLERVKIDFFIDKRDTNLAQKILTKTKINYELYPDLQCAGGLKINVDGGKITIVNTLDLRLEKAIQVLQTELLTLLFPESKN
ncbi:MAG TPA: hypothetical protein DHV62_03455 [Elusimicrobia bacterium]|jgi:vacuolar-type H+-ATPase subunit E/Vma4|nr:hypothetical protein [Elusimicrobiota bacterium]